MLDLPFVRNKTYAVFALGITGISVSQALIAAGAKVIAWDEQESVREEAVTAGLTLADLATADLKGIDTLVLSPGIATQYPKPHPIVARFKDAGIPIASDIELLLQAQPNAKTIAITGTNGKSTTTALVAHILNQCGKKNAVGGNLGQAALTLPPMNSDGTYVLELSSYQLDLLPSFNFDVAVLLNITPDHLDRHNGIDGYIAAKGRIFEGAKTSIIGIDDAASSKLAGTLPGTVISISAMQKFDAGISVSDGMLYVEGKNVAQIDNIITLPGAHNAQNIAAAYAACHASGLQSEAIIAAIRSFPGLSHRQELVDTIDDIRFINDSKATNIGAVQKALVCYDPIYWIAGGRAKTSDYSALDGYLKPVRHAFLIGEAANDMATWLDKQGVTYTIDETLDRAVKHAAVMAKEEDLDHAVVLLSPACSSFDQFPNFEKRGELFRNAVRALEVGAAG